MRYGSPTAINAGTHAFPRGKRRGKREIEEQEMVGRKGRKGKRHRMYGKGGGIEALPNQKFTTTPVVHLVQQCDVAQERI